MPALLAGAFIQWAQTRNRGRP